MTSQAPLCSELLLEFVTGASTKQPTCSQKAPSRLATYGPGGPLQVTSCNTMTYCSLCRAAPMQSIAHYLQQLFGHTDLTISDLTAALILASAAQRQRRGLRIHRALMAPVKRRVHAPSCRLARIVSAGCLEACIRVAARPNVGSRQCYPRPQGCKGWALWRLQNQGEPLLWCLFSWPSITAHAMCLVGYGGTKGFTNLYTLARMLGQEGFKESWGRWLHWAVHG